MLINPSLPVIHDKSRRLGSRCDLTPCVYMSRPPRTRGVVIVMEPPAISPLSIDPLPCNHLIGREICAMTSTSTATGGPVPSQPLPAKEQASFRQLVKLYEGKMYKKALKAADAVLK